jgi:hypothetical protein
MLGSAIRSFKDAFEIQGELGRLVEEATDDNQLGVDWQRMMRICDKVSLPRRGRGRVRA